MFGWRESRRVVEGRWLEGGWNFQQLPPSKHRVNDENKQTKFQTLKLKDRIYIS